MNETIGPCHRRKGNHTTSDLFNAQVTHFLGSENKKKHFLHVCLIFIWRPWRFRAKHENQLRQDLSLFLLISQKKLHLRVEDLLKSPLWVEMFDLESIDYCEAVWLQSTLEIPVEFWCWVKCLISSLIPGLCLCGEELGDWLLCFCSGFIVIVSLRPHWPVRRLLPEVVTGVTVMIKNVVKSITENELYWFMCVKIIVVCTIPLVFFVSAFQWWEQNIIISIFPNGTCFFQVAEVQVSCFSATSAAPCTPAGRLNTWSANNQAQTVEACV